MPSPMTRRSRAGVVSAATVVVALLGAAGAHADTIGPTDLTSGTIGGSFPVHTYVQTADSAHSTLRAPADGLITSWQVNVNEPGSVKLIALTPQPDGTVVERGETSAQNATANQINMYNTPLQVGKGDLLAL